MSDKAETCAECGADLADMRKGSDGKWRCIVHTTPVASPQEGSPLPCPFCHTPRAFQADDIASNEYAIQCARCGARGPFAFDEAESIAAWNRRTPAPFSLSKDDGVLIGMQHCDACGFNNHWTGLPHASCKQCAAPLLTTGMLPAPSRVSELEEEAERQQKGRDQTEQQFADALRARTDLVVKLEAELEAELASRSEDTARLDWLEDERLWVEPITADDQHGEPTRQLWIVDGELIDKMRVTLREAIDAARADAARRSPPAPVYAHVCGIPDKHGDQQQCEACDCDRDCARRSPSEEGK